MNIVETAIDTPTFSTLVAAVKAAGLTDALSGKGPFTVFAPNDAAFAKLPAGAVTDLVKPENKEKLVSLLKLHVLAGKHSASEFAGNDTQYITLGGARISIKGSDGKVSVDKAHVSGVETAASNGVIHTIDTVLTPAA